LKNKIWKETGINSKIILPINLNSNKNFERKEIEDDDTN
jgi:hypothetical protein